MGCGRPVDQELRIVRPDTAEVCPDGVVGEIWVAGPNAGLGCWSRGRSPGPPAARSVARPAGPAAWRGPGHERPLARAREAGHGPDVVAAATGERVSKEEQGGVRTLMAHLPQGRGMRRAGRDRVTRPATTRLEVAAAPRAPRGERRCLPPPPEMRGGIPL